MKKYLVALVFAFAVPSFAFASFNTSLSYGSTGAAVTQLQEFLISQDCLSVQATGYFGSLTFAGVKCFQDKYGVPDTGYFGVMSRAAANAVLSVDACPTQQNCPNEPAQAVQSPVNLSQGVSAVPALSSLVGGGSTTANIQTASSSFTLSSLVGTGSTTVNLASDTTPTSDLSPLVGQGSVSQP